MTQQKHKIETSAMRQLAVAFWSICDGHNPKYSFGGLSIVD